MLINNPKLGEKVSGIPIENQLLTLPIYHHYIKYISSNSEWKKIPISSPYTSKHFVTSFRVLTKKSVRHDNIIHFRVIYFFSFFSFFVLLQTVLLDYICRFEWSVSFIWNITLNDVNIVHDIFEGDDVTLKRFFLYYAMNSHCRCLRV